MSGNSLGHLDPLVTDDPSIPDLALLVRARGGHLPSKHLDHSSVSELDTWNKGLSQ
jgi:hypothetical protein